MSTTASGSTGLSLPESSLISIFPNPSSVSSSSFSASAFLAFAFSAFAFSLAAFFSSFAFFLAAFLSAFASFNSSSAAFKFDSAAFKSKSAFIINLVYSFNSFFIFDNFLPFSFPTFSPSCLFLNCVSLSFQYSTAEAK